MALPGGVIDLNFEGTSQHPAYHLIADTQQFYGEILQLLYNVLHLKICGVCILLIIQHLQETL